MSSPGLSHRVAQSLVSQALEEFALAQSISQPGEGGRAREEIIRRFLRRMLPSGIGIDTGFVIDGSGGVSKQIDIVIYRSGYHPVFEIGGVKYFPVESVVSVLENKAKIKSQARLKEAFENILSVKELDRTGQGMNYLVEGSRRGSDVDVESFNQQVFGIIVGQESMTSRSVVIELTALLAEYPQRRLWPNLYVDVHKFIVTYGGANDPNSAPRHPADAESLMVSHVSDKGALPPLIHLAREVANIVRVAPLIDYKVTNYFPFGGPFPNQTPLPPIPET